MRPKLVEIYDQLYEEGLSERPLAWDSVLEIRDGKEVSVLDHELTSEERFERAERFIRLPRRTNSDDASDETNFVTTSQ